MRSVARIFALLLCCVLCGSAQQNTPHAAYVYPAGGQQGTSFDVTIGGQFLNGSHAALISGEGVHVSFLELLKPVSNDEAMKLRDRLKELMAKWRAANPQSPAARQAAAAQKQTAAADPNAPPAPSFSPTAWTDKDEKEVREIRVKLGQFQLRRTNASLAEMVHLKVSISPNAEIGVHELRIETPNGVTNPLNFYVGQLPEWTKPTAGTVSSEDVNEQGNLRIRIDNPPPTPVVEVTQPVLINGQIAAGGVDSYRFKAHKGEHVVVATSAREIIPYIADAVPGWFQASLTLFDSKGKEVQYADHYSFHPDPALMYEVPEDGEYTVVIHDSIYRGREDFVYRIALGDLPFVTGMFPLGGKAGGKTTVEFTGWNLSQTKLTERSKEKEKGIEMLAPGEAEFNARPFALDTLPETMAKSENHSHNSAQKISLPVIVNGRVAKKNEWEYFQFKGKAGEEIEAEVYARRLDSPLDSILTLMDASGKTIAENDDFVDESAGLLTDQADSRINCKLLADGTYYLKLGDTLRNGGPEYSYRLRVSHPEPDFELRITPSSINAKANSIVPITVFAIRRGGFDGDILLKLKDAPHGFQLSGGLIPGNQSQVRMTISVPTTEGNHTSNHLYLDGFATIGGKDVHRRSVPADDRMQAFFYHHLVTTKDMLVTVNGQQRQLMSWTAHIDHTLTLLTGRTMTLKFDLPPAMAGHVKFVLSEPPDGITLEKSTPYPDGSMLLYLKVDGAKVKPGLRGNLLLTATLERPSPQGKGKNFTQTDLLPAFPFEVLSSAPHPVAGKETAALQKQNQ